MSSDVRTRRIALSMPEGVGYQRLVSDERAAMKQMDGTADTPELARLYEDFAAISTSPLWTQRDDLMPMAPTPRAVPHVWRWKQLFDIAERSGALVPVG